VMPSSFGVLISFHSMLLFVLHALKPDALDLPSPARFHFLFAIDDVFFCLLSMLSSFAIDAVLFCFRGFFPLYASVCPPCAQTRCFGSTLLQRGVSCVSILLFVF